MNAPATSHPSGLDRCARAGRSVSGSECCEIVTTTENPSDLAVCRACPEGMSLMATAGGWKQEVKDMTKKQKPRRGDCPCGKKDAKLYGTEEKGFWCYTCFVQEPWKYPPADAKAEAEPAAVLESPPYAIPPEGELVGGAPGEIVATVDELAGPAAMTERSGLMMSLQDASGDKYAALKGIGAAFGQLSGLSGLSEALSESGSKIAALAHEHMGDGPDADEPSWDDFEAISRPSRDQPLFLSIHAGGKFAISKGLADAVGLKAADHVECRHRGSDLAVRKARDDSPSKHKLTPGRGTARLAFGAVNVHRVVGESLVGRFQVTMTSWGFVAHMDRPVEAKGEAA